MNTDNEIRCGLYEASEQQAIEYNAKLQFRKRYGFPPERTVWLNHPDHYDMVRKRLDHERMDPLFGTEAYMVDFRDLYLLKRPVWIKKVDGNKHADDGPAVLYANGAREYWHNGRAVDPWVVKRPHRVTMRHIKKENNSELKRIFIEKYIEARGHPLFLKRMGARLLHEDEVGKLWGVGRSTSSRNGMFDPFELRTLAVDEVVGRRRRSNTVYEYTMAEVVNSTAEPDGTFKTYYLTTPGNMRTCREAVAWTFALSEDQYKPLVQT